MANEPDKVRIYERANGKLEPVSLGAGARGVTSPKIVLSPVQRGIANYYGSCVEMLETGGGSGDFLKEAVDGGRASSDGGLLHMASVRDCVNLSRRVLAEAGTLSYRPRSASEMGSHSPIQIRALVDAVCVYGADLTELARACGWYVVRGKVKVVPKQQSQKIKAALSGALDAMGEAWIDEGVDVPRWVGTVEVES